MSREDEHEIHDMLGLLGGILIVVAALSGVSYAVAWTVDYNTDDTTQVGCSCP